MSLDVQAIAAGSRPRNRRAILFIGAGLLALAVLSLLSLTQGEADISAETVWQALTSPDGSLEHELVRGMRMPRAVMAMLAGAALAVAGALLQTVTRNPLASAGTFGINAGAYFIVVAATVFVPAWASRMPLVLALVGGAGAAVLAYMLAGGRKGTPVRMALAGMIVSLVLSSMTSAMQLVYENETNGLFMWGSGSLVQNDWAGVQHAWIWILACLIASVYFARTLDLLELSEETARSLGQRIGAVRLAALAAAILLAAVSVSVVGPIGFVGLIAPHLVRLVGFHRHRLLIPASAIWGAAVLVGADTLARFVRGGIGELPAGAVTAAIGAPWLIWLAVRSSRSSQGGDSASATMSVGMLRRKLPFPALSALLAACLAGALLLGLSLGSLRLPIADTALALIGRGDALVEGVMNLRLPRVIVSMLAGAGLAVAGVMIQGAVRNPLADPSLVGVTSGAGVGALLLLVLWPSAPAGWMSAAAVSGGIGSAALVYVLAWKRGLHPTTLILIGIAVTAVNSAAIYVLVLQSGMAAAPALAWLAGSTYARSWPEAAQLAGMLVAIVPLAWYLGRRVELLAFQDSTASGLGLHIRNTRLLAASLGVLAAAITVANVGTIGFIGLLAPHAARMLAGQSHRKLLATAALLGATFLVLADLVGRIAIAPKEIPAGLVAALIGTPYLLFLMYRRQGKA